MATATAKMGTTATAKITGILWGADAKAPVSVPDLSSNVSKMLAVRGSGENLLLLLSLKWELMTTRLCLSEGHVSRHSWRRRVLSRIF